MVRCVSEVHNKVPIRWRDVSLPESYASDRCCFSILPPAKKQPIPANSLAGNGRTFSSSQYNIFSISIFELFSALLLLILYTWLENVTAPAHLGWLIWWVLVGNQQQWAAHCLNLRQPEYVISHHFSFKVFKNNVQIWIMCKELVFTIVSHDRKLDWIS